MTEWLETDGLGGYAMGTSGLVRTRRYHALLCAATRPPVARMVLVNGLEAFVETPAGRFALSAHLYDPFVRHPDGDRRIEGFSSDPWPRWRFRLEDGTRIAMELLMEPGRPLTAVRIALVEGGSATLELRPLLSGRTDHALHHENAALRFDPEPLGDALVFRPYASVPGVAIRSNGTYRHEPLWYRRFLYTDERARGLDFLEDLAAPGAFRFDLSREPAALVLAMDPLARGVDAGALAFVDALIARERTRRAAFGSPLERAASTYLASRGRGRTVIAGYPWFTDWGRDTFLTIHALLGTGIPGVLDRAREVLFEWTGSVSQGMLPNRFPDQGEAPEYNSVDASLLFVRAARRLTSKAESAGAPLPEDARRALAAATDAIIDGHLQGTRHGIRVDPDGLVACGEPSVALTWMDARVRGLPVTPRIGKPVEVQALWIEALAFCERQRRTGGSRRETLAPLLSRAEESFRRRFWDEQRGYLADVVDVDHVPGTVDRSLRPSQLLALPLVDEARRRRALEVIERALVTHAGLRSLAPGEPGYAGRYEGGPEQRNRAYHQGTIWPWLMGPFVDAWLAIRGNSTDARREARERFLDPMLAHLDPTGSGHIPELADADPPHEPRGCPFQAWSTAEAARLAFLLRRSAPDEAAGASSAHARP